MMVYIKHGQGLRYSVAHVHDEAMEETSRPSLGMCNVYIPDHFNEQAANAINFTFVLAFGEENYDYNPCSWQLYCIPLMWTPSVPTSSVLIIEVSFIKGLDLKMYRCVS